MKMGKQQVWRGISVLSLCVLALAGCEQKPAKDAHQATLTAISVRQSAVDVAKRMAARPDPSCAQFPAQERFERWDRSITSLHTQVSLLNPQRSLAWGTVLDQTLRVRQHSGNLALVELDSLQLDSTPHERTRELRRVDGEWFAREDGLPFMRSPSLGAQGADEVARSVESFDRLMSLAGPLQASDEGHFTGPTDTPNVRCTLPQGTAPLWLTSLRKDFKPTSVTATVERDTHGTPIRRHLELSLRARDLSELELRVVLDETFDPGAGEVVRAPETALSAGGPRDFTQVNALMRRAAARRLLPPNLQW